MNNNIQLESEYSQFNNKDLVYNIDKEGHIQSAGYNVNSILMHSKVPPMFSNGNINDHQKGGKVSDLFKDLAIPAGLLLMQQKPIQSYDINIEHNKNKNKDEKIIDDTLFNKLLNMAKQNEIGNENSKNKPRKTRIKKQNNNSKTKKKGNSKK